LLLYSVGKEEKMKNKALEMALSRANFWKKMAKALVIEPQIQIKKPIFLNAKTVPSICKKKKKNLACADYL